MGIEVYVQAFEEGEATAMARSWLRNAFGAELTELEDERWHLRYDDDDSCDLYLRAMDDDASLVKTVVIDRPCQDHRLWNALAYLLGLGNIVLYWPGSRPIIGWPGAEEHLPADLIDALGKPVIVTHGSEIQAQLETT